MRKKYRAVGGGGLRGGYGNCGEAEVEGAIWEKKGLGDFLFFFCFVFVFVFVCLFVCLFFCLFVCFFVCLFFCLK